MNSNTLEQELNKKIAYMDRENFANFIKRCCARYNKYHRDKITDYSLYHHDELISYSFLRGEVDE
jgi:hypothetical protein